MAGVAQLKRIQKSGRRVKHAYKTAQGKMLHGRIEDALELEPLKSLAGSINLIMTSPPFPLVRKKRYGNETGQAYLSWIESLATKLADLLAKDGSIVIEIGNAWEEGSPIMSTLPLEALFAFKKAANLRLCQHIICHNPARLPESAAISVRERPAALARRLTINATLCAPSRSSSTVPQRLMRRNTGPPSMSA
jgi:DNA modification methylase